MAAFLVHLAGGVNEGGCGENGVEDGKGYCCGGGDEIREGSSGAVFSPLLAAVTLHARWRLLVVVMEVRAQIFSPFMEVKT